MTGYVIKRDGEAVGFVDDSRLAEEIDGLSLSNQSADPAYRHTAEYSTERGDQA